jgi:hypothetical protein
MQPSYPSTPPTRAWRVVHYPPVLLAIGMVMVIAPVLLASRALTPLAPVLGPNGTGLLATALSMLLPVAGYRAFNRFVERRPNVEFASAGAARELGAGLLAGVLLFSLVMAAIALGGSYRVTGWNGTAGLVAALAIGLGPGFFEEIVMRGLIFRLVEQWLGSWIALAVSAALFGAAHLANEHATLIAGSAIAIEAGVMLAALYMLTRRLWAAIGLHAAWNFAQGGIYGIPVSGHASNGVLAQVTRGPDWLTGGAFGAEASLPAVVIATLFGLAVLAMAARQGRVVPFRPRRRRPGTSVVAL